MLICCCIAEPKWSCSTGRIIKLSITTTTKMTTIYLIYTCRSMVQNANIILAARYFLSFTAACGWKEGRFDSIEKRVRGISYLPTYICLHSTSIIFFQLTRKTSLSTEPNMIRYLYNGVIQVPVTYQKKINITKRKVPSRLSNNLLIPMANEPHFVVLVADSDHQTTAPVKAPLWNVQFAGGHYRDWVALIHILSKFVSYFLRSIYYIS